MDTIRMVETGSATLARSLVLERRRELALRDIELPLQVGPGQVKIAVDTVGICGSDVHYYTHGRIGPFVVTKPMVLGHEAAGTVIEVGEGVTNLKLGDRVCMEPGIPDAGSRESRLGMYNIDRSVRFWATPPIHGCLTPAVVHPAQFTFRLPESVSFAEGAMVEPFAVGLQAVAKAKIAPGDTAIVVGAGPIGFMIALAALAGGCSRVVIGDVQPGRLALASQFPGLIAANISERSLASVIQELTNGWGADVVFEASGSPKAYDTLMDLPRPGGCIVVVGMPVEPIVLDINTAIPKELRIETVFRYAHQYDRALDLLGSGKVNLKPLISATFDFEDSIGAFERAAESRPTDMKLQIKLARV